MSAKHSARNSTGITTAVGDAVTRPRSRRALIGGLLGGGMAYLAAAVGRGVPAASAAAGGNLVLGQSNNSGTSQTVLTSGAGGASFTLKDTASGGTGIFGWSSATDGFGRGLYGRTDSPFGFAIQAKQLGTAGPGAAIDAQGEANVGIRATSDLTAILATSPSGKAIEANSSAGKAIVAITSSGRAVDATTADGYAVRAVSGEGIAIYGAGVSGSAVYAVSGSGYGVIASSSTGIGLWGNSATNWSVLAEIDARVNNDFQVGGNQSVAGSLSKGGGSFRIDHPLDPANKYLSHSFVESPDMLNVYNGIATLDARGRATIRMPAWFDALNRDFRYQLTALDAAAPDLHVSVRMRDGRFSIAGGGAGQEVSWQVTGIRHDKWANANRIQVEEAKTGRESGTYLHPEIHGQPASRRVPAKHPLPSLKETPR